MDEQKQNGLCVVVPEIYIPNSTVDMHKWSVVACDQYSSQPAYWARAKEIVGDAPSTLEIILPECYLGKSCEERRIARIDTIMQDYLEKGVLKCMGRGFMLVRRETQGRCRLGLMVALDLEQYDYSPSSQTPIRATEGTVVERIPPRLRIRRGAALELPHVLAMIDDPGRTVIEPAAEYACRPAYDFDLMLGGGHVSGCLIEQEEDIARILEALEKLASPEATRQKYGEGVAPLLVAIGDGNHSVATAKAFWEELKATLSAEELKDHPARYCMVELVNVHDEGIVFEPIHRVLFGADDEVLLPLLAKTLADANAGCTVTRYESREAVLGAVARRRAAGENRHLLPFVDHAGYGCLAVDAPSAQLEVGTLQNALDEVVKALPGTRLDYIHGDDVVEELGSAPGCMGFWLPKMDKNKLFSTIIYDGVLPRKTFSMGEANEKRYYRECRKIVK